MASPNPIHTHDDQRETLGAAYRYILSDEWGRARPPEPEPREDEPTDDEEAAQAA